MTATEDEAGRSARTGLHLLIARSDIDSRARLMARRGAIRDDHIGRGRMRADRRWFQALCYLSEEELAAMSA
jgi:hypothetical protein